MDYLESLLRFGICSSRIACIWELSRHPLLIALVAWGLATWYQTRSKRLELRVNTFQEANSAFFRALERVEPHLREMKARSLPSRPVPAREPGIHIHAGGTGYVPGQVTECMALDPIVDQAFSQKVLDHWFSLSASLLKAQASEDPIEVDKMIKSAIQAHAMFINQAGKEVGARPLWRRIAYRLAGRGEGSWRPLE